MKKYSYIVFDVAMVILSVVLAFFLRFDFSISEYQYINIGEYIKLTVASTVVISFIVGCYGSELKYFGFHEIIKQFCVSILVGGVFLAVKLTEDIFISGSIGAIYCIMFFLLSSGIRAIPRFEHFLRVKYGRNASKKARVLIIGAGKAGAMVVKQFKNSEDEFMDAVGILDDDKRKKGKKIAGVKVLGSIEETKKWVKKLGVEEILIAIPSCSEETLAEIFDKVAVVNVPTKIFQSAIDIQNYNKGDKKALKEVTIEDLLFRESIANDSTLNQKFIQGKVVVVTGGAGSIGSELCRQVLENGCKHLVICDINENGLFELNEELKGSFLGEYTTCVASVRDRKRIKAVFEKYKPNIAFHAAAHKHVPMMEINPFEAVKNNILGTRNVIEEAIWHKCEKFVLISTDKAVNPTNVMGATKRVCELLIKSYSNTDTEMVAVRFGNVLGSNGSVIPLFKKQIAKGGPITVTHKDMTRYFMTIKEAVSLVLSAGAQAKGSELFVLDMGKPVKIYDLAIMLVRLSGRTPFKDIDIKVTGLRKGEKLFEELNLGTEIVDNTSHEKIFIIKDTGIDKERVFDYIGKLEELVDVQEDEGMLKIKLFELIDEKKLVSSK